MKLTSPNLLVKMLSWGKTNEMPVPWVHSFAMWRSVSPYLKPVQLYISISCLIFEVPRYNLLVGELTPHEIPQVLSAIIKGVCSISQPLICTFNIRSFFIVISFPEFYCEGNWPVGERAANLVGTVVKVIEGI